MSTREAVLRALLDAEDFVSGNQLAQELNISRSAVWKAIGLLREEGYGVAAVTNRGYRLESSPDLISIPEIERCLKPGEIGGQIELHAEIASTNSRARQLAIEGAPHGSVVLADSQTVGRGRFGRAFYSPKHSGIYISLILRPHMPADQAVMLTSMSAVAVARAIERVADVHASIKWVNDVYLGPRKVCGILCEAGMDFDRGEMEYIVCGIGINVAKMDFPEELRDKATSVSNECGANISRSRLAAELLNEMNALLPSLKSGAFMAESRARSNVIGREIQVLRGGEAYPATALGINDEGSLIVRTPDGRTEALHSGEISVRFS